MTEITILFWVAVGALFLSLLIGGGWLVREARNAPVKQYRDPREGN